MATADQPEPAIVLPDIHDLPAFHEWLETDRKARGLPRCRKCRRGYDPIEEAALIRWCWCFTCEANWLEPRLRRLVHRVGRRAALIAIKRLTK